MITDSMAAEIADLAIEEKAYPGIADSLADLVACNTDDIRDALHRLTHEPDCYQQTVMHLGYDARTIPPDVIP